MPHARSSSFSWSGGPCRERPDLGGGRAWPRRAADPALAGGCHCRPHPRNRRGHLVGGDHRRGRSRRGRLCACLVRCPGGRRPHARRDGRVQRHHRRCHRDRRRRRGSGHPARRGHAGGPRDGRNPGGPPGARRAGQRDRPGLEWGSGWRPGGTARRDERAGWPRPHDLGIRRRARDRHAAPGRRDGRTGGCRRHDRGGPDAGGAGDGRARRRRAPKPRRAWPASRRRRSS